MSPKPEGILFFADRLPPLPGGMEVHAHYFIKHFASHPVFPLKGIITKNKEGEDLLLIGEKKQLIELRKLPSLFHPQIIFFNSGRWIEELISIRLFFPQALFCYRTGGNEILKAPLKYQQITNHADRQAYWVKNLNASLDCLITNSAHTEKRLETVGILSPFLRCVGGVNTRALHTTFLQPSSKIRIFCAARFVAYKNHSLLISVISNLVQEGYELEVRLAGEGPLLQEIKEQVKKERLTSVVSFLGVLDNEKVCKETASAHLYMQLSTQHLTEVPGGSYLHCEGMGRSILEAITAGTFIIAGKSGALEEIVSEDRGLLLDLNDREGITAKISSILAALPKRNPFSEKYDWLHIFNQYETLFLQRERG